MIKYFQASNYGVGFITADDQLQYGLSFSVLGDYVQVTSEDEIQIDKWGKKVSGTEMTEYDYNNAVNQYMVDGMQTNSDFLQSEVNDLNTKVVEKQNIIQSSMLKKGNTIKL